MFTHFSLSEIRNATDNFSEEKKLGEGAFGPVYRVSEIYLYTMWDIIEFFMINNMRRKKNCTINYDKEKNV